MAQSILDDMTIYSNINRTFPSVASRLLKAAVIDMKRCMEDPKCVLDRSVEYYLKKYDDKFHLWMLGSMMYQRCADKTIKVNHIYSPSDFSGQTAERRLVATHYLITASDGDDIVRALHSYLGVSREELDRKEIEKKFTPHRRAYDSINAKDLLQAVTDLADKLSIYGY